MSWKHRCRMVGQPIITEDRPGKNISDCIQEIQDKAVTVVEGSGSASGGGEVQEVEIAVVRNGNTVTISGLVDIGERGEGPKGDKGDKGDRGETWYPPDGELNWLMTWNGSAWVAGVMKAL
jgi:hypothetical protein